MGALEEEDDTTVEDELVRWTLFRGWNIRETSSVLIVSSAPDALLPLPHRGIGCKLGGDATAVICVVFATSYMKSPSPGKSVKNSLTILYLIGLRS